MKHQKDIHDMDIDKLVGSTVNLIGSDCQGFSAVGILKKNGSTYSVSDTRIAGNEFSFKKSNEIGTEDYGDGPELHVNIPFGIDVE